MTGVETRMPSAVQPRCDALLNRSMSDLRQRVSNMRHNRLDPQGWRLVLVECGGGNAQGRRLVESFLPPMHVVPDGDETVFCALEQLSQFEGRLRRLNYPASLVREVHRPVPSGQVAVVCSVVGGIAVVHVPFDEQSLPPPEVERRIVAMPPEGERRYALLRGQLETIIATYLRIVTEGLDPGLFSVLVVDPNANAMGLRLIEEVEADDRFVATMKSEASRGAATTYFNFAQNDQLGPLMADLKIEVDGRVVDSAITQPVRDDSLRVVVCTENGASTFDIDRPVRVGGPGVPDA